MSLPQGRSCTRGLSVSAAAPSARTSFFFPGQEIREQVTPPGFGIGGPTQGVTSGKKPYVSPLVFQEVTRQETRRTGGGPDSALPSGSPAPLHPQLSQDSHLSRGPSAGRRGRRPGPGTVTRARPPAAHLCRRSPLQQDTEGRVGAGLDAAPAHPDPGPRHTCLTVTALPGDDGRRVPADRVGDDAGIGHVLVSRSQRHPQHPSVPEEAVRLHTKVNGALLSPAIGHVSDVGDAAGQERLAGLGGLTVPQHSDEHLYGGPGHCVCARTGKQVWGTGVLGGPVALAPGCP